VTADDAGSRDRHPTSSAAPKPAPGHPPIGGGGPHRARAGYLIASTTTLLLIVLAWAWPALARLAALWVLAAVGCTVIWVAFAEATRWRARRQARTYWQRVNGGHQ
jgi:Flp pilus assembly protein TadB